MTQVLSKTIAPKDLTLGDWLQISEARGFKPRWAFEAWLEVVPSEVISSLSLQDWEAIAGAIDYSETWAYHRYKEHRSKTAEIQ